MDYQEFSGEVISEQDKAFAKEFTNFVNGRMCSAEKTGKELMSRDELAVMDGNKCILQLRGVRPFLSNKYDITKHKRYKELADADPKNAFDVEKYLEHKLVFSQDTEFEVYEVNVTEEDVEENETE